MRCARRGFQAAFRPSRLGVVPPDRGAESPAQVCARRFSAGDLQAVIREPLPHDSASLHVSGEARYVDDLPEPPGRCTRRSACRPRHSRSSSASTSTRCGARPGCGGDHRRGHPGEQQHRAGAAGRAGFRAGQGRVPRPAALRRRGDQRRGCAARGAARSRRIRAARACRYVEQALERQQFVVPSIVVSRGTIRRDSPYTRKRQAALRRAGALLPGRPGGARDSRRARRNARTFVHAASDRGAASRRRGARRARRQGHRRAAGGSAAASAARRRRPRSMPWSRHSSPAPPAGR